MGYLPRNIVISSSHKSFSTHISIYRRLCFVGGAAGLAGRTIVVQRDECEFPVYGREQILFVVERLSHVFSSLENSEIHPTEFEGDQRVRAVVR